MTYLLAIVVDNDPRRTRDVAVEARSAWHAGWLYRQLHPGAKLAAIRARGRVD
jgi:hypothetical protein